jgi:SCP-2 sterol transfer family/HxlR-like helix-turn-helix
MEPHAPGLGRRSLDWRATDLLTARLRTLENAGYVRRRELPRPAPATVYELTESGRRLAPVVLALAKVGLERLGAPGADEKISPAALVLLLRASFHEDHPAQAQAAYQLELDGEPFAVTIADGHVETARGEATNPQCTISTSARTLAQVLAGAIEPTAALAAGDLQLVGPESCLMEFSRSFGYPTVPPLKRRFGSEQARQLRRRLAHHPQPPTPSGR